ncbi:hypothetical protein NMG60_11016489 [Bertholletia excelsa]
MMWKTRIMQGSSGMLLEGLSNSLESRTFWGFFPGSPVCGFSAIGEENGGFDGENGTVRANMVDDHRQMLTKSDGPAKKTVINNLLKLQETEPEFYTDESIKGIIMVDIDLVFSELNLCLLFYVSYNFLVWQYKYASKRI